MAKPRTGLLHPVAVFAAFCLALALSKPAFAGSYQVTSTGSGRVIVKYPDGTSYVPEGQIDLVNDPSWDSASVFFQFGTIDYQYTETFSYTWQPAPGMTIEQDPPETTTAYLEGLATLGLSPTSSSSYISGAGSGALNIGGDGISASITTSPGPTGEDPPDVVSDGVGTAQTWVEVTLSGASGSFTKTYTGSLDTGQSPAVEGYLQTIPDPDLKIKVKPIYQGDAITITGTSPSPLDTAHGITVNYSCNLGGPAGTVYQVEFLTWHVQGGWTSRATSPTFGPPGPRTGSLTWNGPVDHNGHWTLAVRLLTPAGGTVTATQRIRKNIK